MKPNIFKLTGVIVERNKIFYKVKVDNTNHTILAKPSGKIRKSNINILAGDQVKIEVNSHDITKGVIIFRTKNNNSTVCKAKS